MRVDDNKDNFGQFFLMGPFLALRAGTEKNVATSEEKCAYAGYVSRRLFMEGLRFLRNPVHEINYSALIS